MAEQKAAEPKAKEDPNKAFFEKAERALRDLFDKAKAKHELHFAMGLMPEFRGMRDGGWNTAEEASDAFDQFNAHIETLKQDDPMRIRIGLALYLLVAECSGFYEIPKKMMLTVEGRGNNIIPFQKLVKKHRKTGKAIDPNANAIMKDMMGHAFDLGLTELWEVFNEAIDSDLRNAIAHANYTLVNEGVRVAKRNGDEPRMLSWSEFNTIWLRAINLFHLLRNIIEEHVTSYDPPKTIQSRMNDNEPISDFTIFFDPKTSSFGLTTGKEVPKKRFGFQDAAAKPA